MGNIETLTDNAMNNGEITLTVDEPNRKLQYSGELVLGVEHDCRAERVYFEMPQIVGDNIDLSSTDVKIFIDYKNGYNEPYCVECTDKKLTNGVIIFSWLLGSTVTEVKGDVTFTVCVKKIVNGEDFNIWHTIPFVGKVIKGVEPSDHEVIEDDIVDTKQLREEVTVLQNNLTNAEATIQAKVDAGFVTLKSELQNETMVVAKANKANEATKASKDADGNVISETYVKKTGDSADTIDIGQLNVDNIDAGSVTVSGNASVGGNVKIEGEIETSSIYATDEIISEYDIRAQGNVYEGNNKLIDKYALKYIVQDISDVCKCNTESGLLLYDGSYNKGTIEQFSFAEAFYETQFGDQIFSTSAITLHSGDKVKVYLHGGSGHNFTQAGVITIDMFSPTNTSNVIGTGSITFIKPASDIQPPWCEQTMMITAYIRTWGGTTTMAIYGLPLSEPDTEYGSRVYLKKVEILRPFEE